MTPVSIQGSPAELLHESLTRLQGGLLRSVLPIVIALVVLGWSADRLVIALVGAGLPAVAVTLGILWLGGGFAVVLHAAELALPPGVRVPQPPTWTERARRLIQVGAIELMVLAIPAALIGIVDHATGGSIARFSVQEIVWRGRSAGVPVPGPELVAAFTLYSLLHLPGCSWLWSAMAAGYPGGTLRATFVLAGRAGRNTHWLSNGTAAVTGILILCAWTLPPLGLLALAPAVFWPALATTAAARVRPDT
ncbi:MAG TPA: hypothetical protein VKA32_10495 [Gammaproteobacteria bacterium]|nr:hypothetical protein [Gammaproteobacteria bacterium]